MPETQRPTPRRQGANLAQQPTRRRVAAGQQARPAARSSAGGAQKRSTRAARRAASPAQPRQASAQRASARRRPQPTPQEIRRNRIVAAAILVALILGMALLVSSCARACSSDSAAKNDTAEQTTAKKTAATSIKTADKNGNARLSFALNAPLSTPKSAWKQGSMPHLYQTDPAWAWNSYAGATILRRGCGPTSLCQVYICLTGKRDQTPATVAAYAEANGYSAGGQTSWDFFTTGAAALGLSSRSMSNDPATVATALRAGNPVIVSATPGKFTRVGHYFVLYGIDVDGLVSVYDCNSPARSARKWGLVDILNTSNNTWEFWT